MKKNFLLALCFCFANFLSAQDSMNMKRLARWDDESLPISSFYNIQYSGCWGMALNGREYAVIGGSAHVLFFDVTDPVHPQLIGKFTGTSDNTGWREFKSYKNRIYAVSDATEEGLMIFDMSQAPDTIIRTYFSNEFFLRSHTITLDTVSGHIYLNGTDVWPAHNGLLVLDVSQNPDKPTLLANVSLAGGYVHDSYVRNDTIYASSGYEGYYIFDFTDPLSPDSLGYIKTGGYNHSSWLNSEGTYAYYTEEISDGRPIHIIDLQNLADGEIEVAGSFLDRFSTVVTDPVYHDAIPHNVYIRDNLLFNSQYEDGLLVYDISDPTEPILIAHYDTQPENTQYNGYRGNWGSYPWLPSGTIIAGDMQNGLQLLKLDFQVGTYSPAYNLKADVFPNPASETLTVRLKDVASEWSCRLLSLTGQVIQTEQVSSNSQQTLSLKNCSPGLYFVEIQTNEGSKTLKKVVVE
jgi:choice-of-anchor B domain-containing protein